jgi:hypothetical protein
MAKGSYGYLYVVIGTLIVIALVSMVFSKLNEGFCSMSKCAAAYPGSSNSQVFKRMGCSLPWAKCP